LRKHFKTSEEAVTISVIADRINVAHIMFNLKKTNAKALNDLLETKGYLITERTESGNRRRPTAQGQAEGIAWVQKTSANGMEYFQTLFETRSQLLVLDMFLSNP